MIVIVISTGIDAHGDACTFVTDAQQQPEEGSLDFLQRLVGGNIEVIEAGPDVSAFVHADGKFIYPPNPLATVWWLNQLLTTPYTPLPDDFVAGPLVIAGPVDADGNTTDITRAGFDSVTSIISSYELVGTKVTGPRP